MDKVNLLRTVRISAVFFIITIGSTARLLAHDDVRTVTALTIFASGVLAGILILSLKLYKKK